MHRLITQMAHSLCCKIAPHVSKILTAEEANRDISKYAAEDWLEVNQIQPVHPPPQLSAERTCFTIAWRSCRALRAAAMSTLTNFAGVWGWSWPIKSISAEMTVPNMK